MKSHKGQDNASSLFGIEETSCDNQIRNLLDPVPASKIKGVFNSLYQYLEQTGSLKGYDCLSGERLTALDGTEYFSSKKIHCPRCSHRTHRLHSGLDWLLRLGHGMTLPLIPLFTEARP